MIKEIETIREISSRNEHIIQLAEEANELAIAAFEFSNSCKFDDGSYDEAEANLIEEIADVKLCIDIIGDYNNNIIAYESSIPTEQLLEILMVSCCMLSKSAIKYRRTLVKDTNPTPVTEEEAESKLIEMITNIKSCINSIGNYWDSEVVNDIYKEKAIRCINRFSKN